MCYFLQHFALKFSHHVSQPQCRTMRFYLLRFWLPLYVSKFTGHQFFLIKTFYGLGIRLTNKYLCRKTQYNLRKETNTRSVVIKSILHSITIPGTKNNYCHYLKYRENKTSPYSNKFRLFVIYSSSYWMQHEIWVM